MPVGNVLKKTVGKHRRSDVVDCVVELNGIYVGVMDRFATDENGEREVR